MHKLFNPTVYFHCKLLLRNSGCGLLKPQSLDLVFCNSRSSLSKFQIRTFELQNSRSGGLSLLRIRTFEFQRSLKLRIPAFQNSGSGPLNFKTPDPDFSNLFQNSGSGLLKPQSLDLDTFQMLGTVLDVKI